MAVTSLQSNAFSPRPITNLISGQVMQYEGLESASHAGIDGSVLIFASGLLDAGAADLTTGLVGFQSGPAKGVTSAVLPYTPALPGLLLEMTLEDQTNEDHALAQANIGVLYALQIDNDGVWYIDENDTSNDSVMIVGYPPDTAIGDVRARVYAIILGSTSIWSA